jgi:hypothetical protein
LVFEGQQFSCSGLVAPFSLPTQLQFFDSLCSLAWILSNSWGNLWLKLEN